VSIWRVLPRVSVRSLPNHWLTFLVDVFLLLCCVGVGVGGVRGVLLYCYVLLRAVMCCAVLCCVVLCCVACCL